MTTIEEPVKAYFFIQEWVDRQWRAPGMQYKILLLPAIIPLLVISMVNRTQISSLIGWGWFGIWNSFVMWRYWRYMREVSVESDRNYDHVGKYKLSREYHDTESATATAEKNRLSKTTTDSHEELSHARAESLGLRRMGLTWLVNRWRKR